MSGKPGSSCWAEYGYPRFLSELSPPTFTLFGGVPCLWTQPLALISPPAFALSGQRTAAPCHSCGTTSAGYFHARTGTHRSGSLS